MPGSLLPFINTGDAVLPNVLIEIAQGTVTTTVSVRFIAGYGFEAGSEVLALARASKAGLAALQ